MATQGPNPPATAANDSSVGTFSWDVPDNVFACDDAYAGAFLNDIGDTTEYLVATNFGFTIPSGSTINGITVSVERNCTSANALEDFRARIVKGGTIGATDKADTSTFWPFADTVANYGGIADLWGETWTHSDINASTFGFALAATHPADGDTGLANIDCVTITITYTAAAGGLAWIRA